MNNNSSNSLFSADFTQNRLKALRIAQCKQPDLVRPCLNCNLASYIHIQNLSGIASFACLGENSFLSTNPLPAASPT